MLSITLSLNWRFHPLLKIVEYNAIENIQELTFILNLLLSNSLFINKFIFITVFLYLFLSLLCIIYEIFLVIHI